MTKPNYDVIGIGSAIVDILSFCEESFLTAQKLTKSSMELIDETRADLLYNAARQTSTCSGGSVANSMAGIASLGGRAAFIGKVKSDQLGSIFAHDMKAVGVHFSTRASGIGPATGRCFVFVAPDGERTMATYLGACTGLSNADMDEALISDSAVLYIEGYQWDQPQAKIAIRTAIAMAHKAGRKVAFTLSDSFCVHRHREEFLQLLDDGIDILFANEFELMALFETDDLSKALKAIQQKCDVSAVTRSEKGCVVVTQKGHETVAGERVAQVMDTTGAGDLFASGFLYGYTHGWDYAACAKLGNKCAATILAQLGARALRPLTRLVA